ncbi:hypothetical protein [Lactococcus lactis]|uniref:Uncharacterized protein n=1 Tax=Lactococcus lactis subsp. lactis TaxID=1360 RepID=A0A0V8EAK5_LACLL|nr:hypothetical protein [Lactococcus lactis]KSU22497.1 hypothetical protein M20_0551 [Lactococcus lactis subsp. lactis]
MKKLLHFLVVLLGIFVAFILARLFIEIYTIVGDVYLQVDNKTITLYKVLAEIDYLSVGITFAMVFAYMLLLDLIVVVVVRSWFKIQNKSQKVWKNKFTKLWFRYRSIHITFILLSIFTSLLLTAPAMVMNSFTAIVSISVLVINLSKKIG